jgi:hypothetical protein
MSGMFLSGDFAIAPAEAISRVREMPIVWRNGIRLRLLSCWGTPPPCHYYWYELGMQTDAVRDYYRASG